MRRGYRRPLLALLLVALVAGACWALLQTSGVRQRIAHEIAARVSAGIDGSLDIGGIEGDLVRTLRLTDVRLVGPDGPVLAARAVTFEYDLLRLVSAAGLTVHAVTIDGLDGALAHDGEAWNWERALAATGSDDDSSGLAVTVERLRTRGAELQVRHADAVWQIRELALAAALVVGDTVALDVQALAALVQRAGLPAARVRATLVLDAAGTLGVRTRVRTASSAARAEVHVTGPDDRRYDVDVDAHRLAAVDLEALTGLVWPDELSGRFRAAGPASGVVIDARVQAGEGGLTVEGRVDLTAAAPVYDLRVRADALVPVATEPSGRTVLSGRAEVAGRGLDVANDTAAFALELEPGTVAGLPVDALEARGRLEAGALVLDRFQVRSPLARVDVAGALGLRAGVPVGPGLRWSVASDDVRPLARRFAALPLRGALELSGVATGHVGALDLEATGSVAGLAGDHVATATAVLTASAQGVGSAGARAEASVRVEDAVVLGHPFATVALAGEWSAGQAVGGDLRLHVNAREPEGAGHVLKAAVSIGADSLEATVETLDLTLAGERWLLRAPARMTRAGAALGIDLALESAGGATVELSGDASGALARDGALDLSFEIAALPLGQLPLPATVAIEGELHAEARIAGRGDAPVVEAALRVAAPRLGGVACEHLEAELRSAGGTASMAGRLVQSADAAVDVSATLPLTLQIAPLVVEATGDLAARIGAEAVDLAVLRPFVSELDEIGGRLDAALSITGPLEALAARGTIAVADGRARALPLGVTYDPIVLDARFDGQAVLVERLQVGSGDGRLTGQGTVALHGDTLASELDLALSSFPLFSNEWGSGAASGEIRLRGTNATPRVEGKLETDRLEIRLPEEQRSVAAEPDPTIVIVADGIGEDEVAAVHPPAESAAALRLYDRAAVELAIDVPHNAWLRRSDAQIELAGWLAVAKAAGAPALFSGEIDTVRGWYTFRGKRFKVEEGTLTLTGGDPDPRLDLVAVHRAGEYQVRVILTGTVTKPTLALTSDPPLGQADVLAVLLFGEPTNDLTDGQSTALRTQAAAIAGSYAAGGLSQSVASRLGLDTLQFESGSDGLADSEVTVGKYVTDDVFMSLSHALDGTDDEVRLEYRLTPEWSLEASRGTRGHSGVDILWRRRY